jgi:acetyl-CoA acetyltransferase
MDFAQLYDCFTISVLIELEDLGFCPKGESGHFVEEGNLDLGAPLPVNTHGGLLSHGHPGRVGGLFHIIEAVRQLRGQAKGRQIKNASLGLVHGLGGIMATHSTIILGRQDL